MTQRILLDANSDYLIHFDDDSYPTSSHWLKGVTESVNNSKRDVKLWGRRYGVKFGKRHQDFLKFCSWYNGEYNLGDSTVGSLIILNFGALILIIDLWTWEAKIDGLD